MTNLIEIARFREQCRAGKPPAGGVVRVEAGAIKALDDGRRAIRFCFSDGSIDRAGDTIDPKGWRLDGFLKNPVALWAHDSSAPPIGKASHLVIEDNKLMGDIEFAPAEIYPFADTVYRLCREKYVNAVSVGFLPIEYSWSNDDDRQFGMDFEEQELLEISVVPVPCNANALMDARAKGIDIRPVMEWAETLLDGGGKVILPKKELEQLRKAAKPPKASRRRKPEAPKSEEEPEDDKAPSGMGETDPSDGGFLGKCGRKSDEECGMKDPAECEIHGPLLDDGDKEMSAEIVKLLKSLQSDVRRLKAAGKRAPKRRDMGEGDGEPDGDDLDKAMMHHKDAADAFDEMPDHEDDPEEHAKCVRSAHAHIKAADEYLESYRAMKGIDMPNQEHEEAEDPDEAEERRLRTAQLAR